MSAAAATVIATCAMSAAPVDVTVVGAINDHQVLRSSNNKNGTFIGCRDALDVWKVFDETGDTDSPLDDDHQALRLTLPAGCYISLRSRASGNLRRPVEAVTNLSFDYRTADGTPPGTSTDRSPRLVAIVTGGAALFMDASQCSAPIDGSDGSWARMDPTGFTSTDAPCTIVDSHFESYTNTPSMSAFDVYAEAHPGTSLIRTFFIVDDEGTYYIDRLALGTGRMYTASNDHARRCPDEAAC